MKIIHISDTHNLHQELPILPDGDVLVHTGDCTMAGTENEAYNFLNWLCDQPYPHKILIAGNHDFCFYGATGVEGLPDNVHYLSNSEVTIDGVRFYGVPLFMQDIVDAKYDDMLKAIPVGTDVLLSHQPPTENAILASRMAEIKVCASLFGHNHECYGQWQENGTTFSNAAIVNNDYQVVNKPQVIIINNRLL